MLAALPIRVLIDGQLGTAFDVPREPVDLDVLLDVDTVSEDTSCFDALAVLLATHGVRAWRYSDDGPPNEATWDGEAVPAMGWIEVDTCDVERHESARPVVTHVARRTDRKRERTAFLWGHPDKSQRELPWELLGRVAVDSGMGLLVTNRRGLVDSNGPRWRGGTLVVTPEQAVATLGLLLRKAGCFSVGPYSVTNRGTYLWLAMDSVLPHYEPWAAACSTDSVFGRGRVYYLSTATEGRVFQALGARDQVSVALSQVRIDWIEVADAVDRFLVFLLAAMDSTARVVSEIAIVDEKLRAQNTGWQFRTFLKVLQRDVPQLAALFGAETPAADLHLVLRELRNTIHGGGLTRTHVLKDDNDIEHKLSIPRDEVQGLADAVARQTGGNPARWGIRLTDDRVWIQPLRLVDAMTREGFRVLDQIFEHTPLDQLTALAKELNDDEGAGVYEPDAVERSSWELTERLFETRGSDMYLWHLGMHPDQTG